MIDTLINAYRVCSNKKYLCFQEVNIFDLINEASYSLEKMLKDKNIELYVKSEEKGYIYADRSLL